MVSYCNANADTKMFFSYLSLYICIKWHLFNFFGDSWHIVITSVHLIDLYKLLVVENWVKDGVSKENEHLSDRQNNKNHIATW